MDQDGSQQSGKPTAGRPTLPPDIKHEQGSIRFVGMLLIAAAGFPAIPIYSTVRQSGFARMADWPDIFFFLALLSVGLVSVGLLFALMKRPSGAAVAFHSGGFTIRVRNFSRFREDRYDWSDIAEIEAVSLSGNTDFFIRRVGKARQHYATTQIVVGERAFFTRLRASAAEAGYRRTSRGSISSFTKNRSAQCAAPRNEPSAPAAGHGRRCSRLTDNQYYVIITLPNRWQSGLAWRKALRNAL